MRMDELRQIELDLARDYATKVDLGRVEGKVEIVRDDVVKIQTSMAVIAHDLTSIKKAAEKIVWLIAGPLLASAVAGFIWVLGQMAV